MTADRKNEGKAMVELIDPEFILGLGQVMEMGVRKYAADDWKGSVNTADHHPFVRNRFGSLLRHALAAASGEEFDAESGLPHMYHIAANAMFIQHYNDAAMTAIGQGIPSESQ